MPWCGGSLRKDPRQRAIGTEPPRRKRGVEDLQQHDGSRASAPTFPDLGSWKLLAEQMRDILLLVRPGDGRILEANSAAIAAYGYSRDALLRMHVGDLRTPDERSSTGSQLLAAERDGLLFETVHMRCDGRELPVEVNARGADFGGQRLIISVVRDISRRKHAEEGLRRSHDTFYHLIQNAPFGVYVIDSRFRVAQVSAGSQRVFDGVRRPLIGRDFAEVLRAVWPEPFASEAIARFRHTLATGEPYHAPATVERRADVAEVEAYDWRLERITLPDGELGVVCYFYDLSERRRYESALHASQERQRIAVESAHLGVFEWHITDDRAVWENDRPYEIFGRDPNLGPVGREEFIRDFIVPEDRAAFESQSASDAISGNRVTWTLRIRRPSGEVRWIEITGNVSRDEQDTPTRMLGVVRDITDRATAEAVIRESEERFRSLANAMPQLVWTANSRGVVTYYNSQAQKYSGIVRDDAGAWRWEPLVHPDDVEATIRAWNTAVVSGDTYQCEHRVQMADGSYRWHLSRAFRSSDATQWFGTATDVHELKQTAEALRISQRELASHKEDLERRIEERTVELTATHDRLRLSERFAMMGTLAAGLGHDLGNLLVPVRVRLESLSHAPMNEQSREDIDAIKSSAEYLRRLAQGLRLLSLDPERSSPSETTDLATWWRDVQGVLKSVLPRGVELEGDIPADAGVARISRPALTQAVFNIFQNAGDAMRDRGSGTVRIRADRSDDSILIAVEDNGPGMSDEVKARCMEPFFTTKSRGISTGLGLVLVYGLIRDAGGSVDLDSHLDRGTRFTLHLPAVRTPSADSVAHGACIIDIKDPRVRSIVTGELARLNVEPHHWDSRDGREGAAVIDDPAKIAELPPGAFAVLLATSPTAEPNLRVIGDRPHIGELREAIRDVIRAATIDSASSKPK